MTMRRHRRALDRAYQPSTVLGMPSWLPVVGAVSFVLIVGGAYLAARENRIRRDRERADFVRQVEHDRWLEEMEAGRARDRWERERAAERAERAERARWQSTAFRSR